MVNVCTFLYYVHVTTYDQINEKLICFPYILSVSARTYCSDCNNWIPICTYISHVLVWFNTQGHFCVRLYGRVTNADQPVNCAIKYHTKIKCHNIHNYTQACFTHHHTLLHTCNIHNMKTILFQPVNCTGKYCKKTKLSLSTQLQTHTIHT